MAKLNRRNHTVTRFYLARFANDSDRLRRVPLEDPTRAHLISITNASVQKDFYIVEEQDGTRSDRIERLFGVIEGESALGFKALLDDRQWPITEQTRERIAAWVALQYLRGLGPRSMMSEISDILFKLQIAIGGPEGIRDALEGDAQASVSEEKVNEVFTKYSATDSFRLEVGANEHIKFIGEQLPGVTRLMFARQWTVVRFERKVLLTSDHPVVLIRAAGEDDFLGVGVMTAGNIFVPLSRRVGLLLGEVPVKGPGGKSGSWDTQRPGTTALADCFNSYVISNAREAIFTHPDDSHLTDRPLPTPRREEVVHPDYEQWRGAGEQLRSAKEGQITPAVGDSNSSQQVREKDHRS